MTRSLFFISVWLSFLLLPAVMSAWLVSIRQLRHVILGKAKNLRGLTNY